MALLTNEQKAELIDLMVTCEDMQENAVLALNDEKVDPQLILNDLHEIQDRVNRMVTKLEDIING